MGSFSSPASPIRRIILFGRYPLPGHTKTRLIPSLGPLGAAELQRHLTQRTLAAVLNYPGAAVEFCYCGGSRAQVERWLGKGRIELYRQAGGNLGARMQAAIQSALDRGYRQVVLVGTDIPGLESTHLAAAFNALNDHDLVFGPSRDGGYWLVGTRRRAHVFSNIAWGTFDVLDRTLAAARRQGLKVAQLSPLDDIDTESDLRNWTNDLSWEEPFISIVIPTLNEAAGIERAIQQLRSPDTQVIVADGGSSDATRTLARRAGAQVVFAPRGRAAQQNAGAQSATGRILLFLHADTRLPADFGARIFETMLNQKVVLGAFRFKTDMNHWAMRLIETAAHIRSTLMKMPYGDQALFMRKSLFDRIGGFPEVPVAEDLFMIRRVAGWGKIVLTRQQAVTSARRWRRIGIWRVTLANYIIAAGCLLGVAPERLAVLYQRWLDKPRRSS